MGLRDVWRRLWDVPAVEAQLNEKCPICGAGVVVEANTMLGSTYSGPMMAPIPSQELIAACAMHGRPPFNDRTVQYRARSEGKPDETDGR